MYPLIKIPEFASKDIYSFSKEEAKEYFKWFMNIKNERLQILESEVQKEYHEWKSDYSKKSLLKLYEWFKSKVEYRMIDHEEADSIKEQIAKTPKYIEVIDVPLKTYTEETVSICFDVAAYFGEVFIYNIPSVKWIQKINSKNYIDYAQPLISKSDTKYGFFNPRRLMESLAYDVLNKKNNTETLIDIFDKTW